MQTHVTSHVKGSGFEELRSELSQSDEYRGLVQEFFANKDLWLGATFEKTSIPTPLGVNLDLRSGAQVSFRPRTNRNALLFPDQIRFHGFSVLSPLLLSVEGVGVTPEGELEAHLRTPFWNFFLNITDQVMASAAGVLFSGGRVDSIPFSRLWEEGVKRVFGKGDSGPASDSSSIQSAREGFFTSLIQASRELIFVADATPATLECSPRSHVQIFLDVKQVRENLGSGRYREFDFSGIQKESFIEWPGLHFSHISALRRAGLKHGVSDISWSYDPDAKRTEIRLENLDFEFQLPGMIGGSARVTGRLGVILEAGGKVRIRSDQLSFQGPVPLLRSRALLFLRGDLMGEISLRHQPEGDLVPEEVRLSLTGLKLETMPGHPLAAVLRGSLEIDSHSREPISPPRVNWTLEGEGLIKEGTHTIEFQNLRFRGRGQDLLDGSLSADLLVGGILMHPRMDFQGVQSGSPFWEKDNWVSQGEAALSIGSNDVSLDLGAQAFFQVGGLGLQAVIRFLRDQKVGPVVAEGQADLYLEGLDTFQVNTPKPYRIRLEDKKVADGVQISGRTTSQGGRLSVDMPSLMDRIRASAAILRRSHEDRWHGPFRVEAKSFRRAELNLEDLVVLGEVSLPRLRRIISEPRASVAGNLQARAMSLVEIPIASSFFGDLRFLSWEEGRLPTASFTLDPARESILNFGRVNLMDRRVEFEGTTRLKGTLTVSGDIRRRALQVTGSDLGAFNAKVFGSLDGVHAVDQKGQLVPVVDPLRVSIRELRGISRGVAEVRGVELDMTERPYAIGLTTDRDDVQRTYNSSDQRIFYSLEGFFRLFDECRLRSGACISKDREGQSLLPWGGPHEGE